jgi:hypothetical protein
MALVPFDDRDGWIWMDGDFVPWREAKTHVLTHALHYGSSVFEGERMYGGEIFKLRALAEEGEARWSLSRQQLQGAQSTSRPLWMSQSATELRRS